MMGMDRRIIAAIVIIAIAVAAVLLYMGFKRNDEEPPTNIEHIGGKYNATLSFWEEGWAKIEYTDKDGKHSDMYFMVEMRNGLDWIKNNTTEDATFLCWWDYGHMIKGYAERNVVVRNPSDEILESIRDPSGITEFDPHEKILDVAAALATSNSTEMSQIIQNYNVTYILVCTDEEFKAHWIYKIAGLEPADYLARQDSGREFTEAGMHACQASGE